MNLISSSTAPHRRNQNRPFGAGFTLIEVALAIVALGLGVLAAYYLLSSGLDTGQKAGADTQAAVFADSVLSTLRVESEHAAKQGNWTTFWSQFAGGSNIPVAFQEAWDEDLTVQASQGGAIHAIVFTNYGFRADAPTNIVNSALRYTLAVTPYSDRAEALLQVWNCQYATNSDETAFTFYSEYGRMGEL